MENNKKIYKIDTIKSINNFTLGPIRQSVQNSMLGFPPSASTQRVPKPSDKFTVSERSNMSQVLVSDSITNLFYNIISQVNIPKRPIKKLNQTLYHSVCIIKLSQCILPEEKEYLSKQNEILNQMITSMQLHYQTLKRNSIIPPVFKSKLKYTKTFNVMNKHTLSLHFDNNLSTKEHPNKKEFKKLNTKSSHASHVSQTKRDKNRFNKNFMRMNNLNNYFDPLKESTEISPKKVRVKIEVTKLFDRMGCKYNVPTKELSNQKSTTLIKQDTKSQKIMKFPSKSKEELVLNEESSSAHSDVKKHEDTGTSNTESFEQRFEMNKNRSHTEKQRRKKGSGRPSYLVRPRGYSNKELLQNGIKNLNKSSIIKIINNVRIPRKNIDNSALLTKNINKDNLKDVIDDYKNKNMFLFQNTEEEKKIFDEMQKLKP